ncbi:9057_t:CDS:2 [Funneliformis mosseae]|uniref:9057_t:CDS:1 n=1 Tax=Funneliformis mosseae TaxID=27381 RepID=A0A9N9N393_FUNMO|nr:9057_t:CDS:2 [Funneliformis mosseae]
MSMTVEIIQRPSQGHQYVTSPLARIKLDQFGTLCRSQNLTSYGFEPFSNKENNVQKNLLASSKSLQLQFVQPSR